MHPGKGRLYQPSYSSNAPGTGKTEDFKKFSPFEDKVKLPFTHTPTPYPEMDHFFLWKISDAQF